MFGSILVPLDGSELAEVALPYAEELVGRLGSGVILVHVCESDDAEDQRTQRLYVERVVEATREGAARYLGESGAKPIEVKSALLRGHPAEQIVDYADSENVGLIVMATHGRSGIRRWVLGGVADKVVRATSRPLVLIRAQGARADVRETGALNRVLVPLDGSDESEVVLPYVEELASKLKGEVVLFQVVAPAYFAYSIPGETVQMFHTEEEIGLLMTKAQGYLDDVGAAVRGKGIEVRCEVGVGGAAEEIVSAADAMGADMVAMSTHGRSGVGRWTFGSTADRVLQAGSTPVLLVRVPSGGAE